MEELCLARTTGHSMIEPLLCGIVLGLIPVTLTGLFVAAWNQYRRLTPQTKEINTAMISKLASA